MNRLTFQQLAETRLLDAKALLQAGRFDASYYLAGYVVECALKACLAKKTREHDFPERDASKYYSHNLTKLLENVALIEFEQDLRSDSILAGYWDLVTRWNEESRYQPGGTEAEKLAENIVARHRGSGTRSFAMLIEVLVRDQIEGGESVLDTLQAEGFPVTGAFWCRIPDEDYWKLIIASVFVSQEGPLAAYQKVRAILAKRPVAEISTSDISLFSPIDPEYLRLREHAFGRSEFGVGPRTGIPRNTRFTDAFAYV